MQLAVFDLDGTLTRTTHVDAVCFVDAMREELGIAAIDTNWTQYAHSTDSGITAEIFQRHLDRLPTADEVLRFQQRFVDRLAETFRREPESCSEIPGAATALRQLRSHPRWRIALATGSWRASAALKIATAGLDLDGVPAAFADDSVLREEIVTLAQSRACQRYCRDTFSRIVYIGDAPWDVRTAQRLEVPFVGIGIGRGAERLRCEGASAVLADFTDFDRLLRALQEAVAPPRLRR